MRAMASNHPPRLADHWLFTGVSAADLAPLHRSAREFRCLPGEVIFRQGDASDGLYLILAGTARVSATGPAGSVVLTVAGANEVLGEMGVMDGQPRSGTATALAFCAGYFVPSETFLDLLEISPGVCMRMLVLVSQRLRRVAGRLGELPAADKLGLLTSSNPS
jgi:CRP-like cAMP-binding protein